MLRILKFLFENIASIIIINLYFSLCSIFAYNFIIKRLQQNFIQHFFLIFTCVHTLDYS